MKPLLRPGLLALAVVAGVLLLSDPARAQCAMCQTALMGSPEGRAMSQSLGRAILLLVAAPYLVAAVFATLLFRDRIAPFLRRLGLKGLRSPVPPALGRPNPPLA